jgi:Photosynthetic reaction centre cytochrome C subunit
MRIVIAGLFFALFAAAQSNDLPVEQTKKNIKVLQGLPSSQLIPVMAFMTNSLGVTCAHCHSKAWESDEKPAKETARKMIAMERDINARNFDGKIVVTCNSCHQGHIRPNGIPDIANAGWNHVPSAPAGATAPLPTIEALLARLPSVPAGITTRVVSGTVERYNGRDDPKSGPFTLTITAGKIDYKTELSHPPEANRALAAFVFAAMPKSSRVIAADRIEMANGEVWTIDEKRGVVIKRHRELTTALGILPEEIEYDDWRDSDGTKLPFVARWLRADYRVVFTVHDITNGGSVRQ